MELLRAADVFYMGGAFDGELQRLLADDSAAAALSELSRLVSRGALFYIGCCGGSMMAGRHFSPKRGFSMLDVLHGVSIGMEDEAHEAVLEPHINLTPKAAVLVYATERDVEVAAFICTKCGTYKYQDVVVAMRHKLLGFLRDPARRGSITAGLKALLPAWFSRGVRWAHHRLAAHCT